MASNMLFCAAVLATIATLATGSYISPALTLPATPALPAWYHADYHKTEDGSSIWYARFGHASSPNQPIVTFLHGGLANSNYWGKQIGHLVSRGYTCLAVDSRGHGRSSDKSHQKISYNKMTNDVIEILDHLQIERTVIVGWSDGANIGLDMAMHNSARLSGVFAFGATYSPANTNASVTTNPIFTNYLRRSAKEYVRLNPRPQNLHALQKKVENLWTTLPKWTQRSFQRVTPLSKGGPLVWIVDGAEEEAINRTTPSEISNWIPDSSLAILPMVSHFAFLQDSETFNGMLDRFLQYVGGYEPH